MFTINRQGVYFTRTWGPGAAQGFLAHGKRIFFANLGGRAVQDRPYIFITLSEDSWLMAHGSWLMALNSWLMALNSWLMAHGSWLLALGSWLLALGSWLMAHGSWLMVPGSWLMAPGSWLNNRKRLFYLGLGAGRTQGPPLHFYLRFLGGFFPCS